MNDDDCQALGGCPDSRLERLYEYLDGALSQEDIGEIRAHLEACPHCLQEHDLECVIRSMVKRCCSESAPQTLKESIIDRITSVQAAAH